MGYGIALLIWIPNLLWQWQHDWPFFDHMRALNRSQLANTRPSDFLIGQLLLELPIFYTFLGGLVFLWVLPGGKPYWVLGIVTAGVLLILLALKGKHYYAAGLHPLILAGGSVLLERITFKMRWIRLLPIAISLPLIIPVIPVGVPVVPLDRAPAYFEWAANDLGLESILRWEDGELHALPQDFADMFGWTEIGDLTQKAIDLAGAPKEEIMIYGDNYGRSASALHYAAPKGDPIVTGFNGSFGLWAPQTTNANTLIYINDQLGSDVEALFQKIDTVGSVQNRYARERGTVVILCQKPLQPFGPFWEERVKAVQKNWDVF